MPALLAGLLRAWNPGGAQEGEPGWVGGVLADTIQETFMQPLARRSILLGIAALPAVYATAAWAVDALPDSRFVGYAQQLNDFEIASGRLALTKSTNENIRGF